MASFSRKRKRGYRMQIQIAAESHVPCFQERGGTSIPGYMIPDRLPWRLRARPSATLHEIQVCPKKGKLVPSMLQNVGLDVKGYRSYQQLYRCSITVVRLADQVKSLTPRVR